jgi:1-deoxy-D-xylulose-5-phosphate reductoisomerase
MSFPVTAPKSIALLGSTGSIGTQVLELVQQFPDRFSVCGLVAGRNIALLQKQMEIFRPRWVSVAGEEEAVALQKCRVMSYAPDILWGLKGHDQIASMEEADLVVSALVGAVGLRPTLAAIRAGKAVALANKETLVMAGSLVMAEARRMGVAILPVDSEHSAIFQVLQGQRRDSVKRIILTASGGPFRDHSPEQMDRITREEALRHPNWKMGPKISIDSATLMNKGLEVMEAQWLFGIPLEQVAIAIHPQSIIHSLVEYRDGSILAQMGLPDMRVPIAYALAYPDRLPLNQASLDLTQLDGLTFLDPDPEKFPCLGLALRAAKTGQSLPIVLNAANEVAVEAFLRGELNFSGIPEVIRRMLDRHAIITPEGLEEILAVDLRTRRETAAVILSLKNKNS